MRRRWKMDEMKAYYIVIGSVFGLFGKVLYDLIPVTVLKLIGYSNITNDELAIVFFKGSVGVVVGCTLFLLANVLFKNRNNTNSNTQ